MSVSVAYFYYCLMANFQVSVVLNLTPDHLDRHGMMKNYAMTKSRIFSRMSHPKLAILPLGMHLIWVYIFPREHLNLSPSIFFII